MGRGKSAAFVVALCAPLFVSALSTAPRAAAATAAPGDLSKVNHIVVIFEENRAFDNIYSGWPGDNAGLTISYHQTSGLPIYQYLMGPGAPNFAVADRFFHAAFGGSYLNHQWLIAGDTPVWPNAPKSGADDQHSIVGADGYPGKSLLHPQTPGTKDNALTQAANPDGSCAVPAGSPTPPSGTVCGDYPVNTVQPMNQPYKPKTPDARRMPPATNPTVGDRLSDKGVDWAYYSGGWDNATGNTTGSGWTNGSGPKCSDGHVDINAAYPNCPDEWFQYHHQPFNYYPRYAPGTPDRAA